MHDGDCYICLIQKSYTKTLYNIYMILYAKTQG